MSEAEPISEGQFFMEMFQTLGVIDQAKNALRECWRECPENAKQLFRQKMHRFTDRLYVETFTYCGTKSTFRILLNGKTLPCKASTIPGAKKAFERLQSKTPGEGKLEVLAPNGEWLEVAS